jgi:hypothetical protein
LTAEWQISGLEVKLVELKNQIESKKHEKDQLEQALANEVSGDR